MATATAGSGGARRPLVAGNWKMNGLKAQIAEVTRLTDALASGRVPAHVDLMLCPPATLVGDLARAAAGSALIVGGQDCHVAASGANTGDVAAEMLADAGAKAVILGHSERRADHGELDRMVAAKVGAARRAGLAPIVCVGETAGQRAAGLTLTVVGRQVRQSVPDGAPGALVIAYEPVWAIGTGLTPTAGDVAQVHAFIRTELVARFGAEGEGIRILYGGSVKPSNARELMSIVDVDGALVGGASLKADDFLGIVDAYRA